MRLNRVGGILYFISFIWREEARIKYWMGKMNWSYAIISLVAYDCAMIRIVILTANHDFIG